jgi:hypothetical protein
VKGRSTVSNLVQFANGVIGEIEDGWQVDGVYTDISKALKSVEVQFINFIWWFAFVLDGVLSDRSKTTCQFDGRLFVRVNSIFFRGFAEESFETNFFHFGYKRRIGPLGKCE